MKDKPLVNTAAVDEKLSEARDAESIALDKTYPRVDQEGEGTPSPETFVSKSEEKRVTTQRKARAVRPVECVCGTVMRSAEDAKAHMAEHPDWKIKVPDTADTVSMADVKKAAKRKGKEKIQRISDEDAAELRRLRAEDPKKNSLVALGQRFGLTHQQAWHVCNPPKPKA